MNKEGLVFCRDCKYFKKAGRYSPRSYEECEHTANTKSKYNYMGEIETAYILRPGTINKDCNCLYYEAKTKDKTKRGLLSIFTLGEHEGGLSLK